MTNNLYWVFTKYGRSRLINFSSTDKLYLYNAKIGSYNWFEDPKRILEGGYTESNFKKYFENIDEATLGEPIENGTLPITRKELLSDNKTVILSAVVSEVFAECNIREFGIYETDTNGFEHLFAICTMQELHKPSIDTNHFMSSEFKARLKSNALSSVYDRIILNPDNDYATEDQINEIEKNMLFVESNLAEQISNNAHIIGLNRPQQLYEKILEDKKKFSSFAASTAYANFLNITTLDRVPAFWVFQHNKRLSRASAISDIGSSGIYLEADILSTQFEQGYEGLCSWLNVSENHYYKLGQDVPFNLLSSGTPNLLSVLDIEDNENAIPAEYDSKPFSFFWIGSHNKVKGEFSDKYSNKINSKGTLNKKTNLPKSGNTEGDTYFVYEEGCCFYWNSEEDAWEKLDNYTLMSKFNRNTVEENPPEFLFQVTPDRRVLVRLYSTRENYMEALTVKDSVPETDEFYVLTVKYSGDYGEARPFQILINSDKVDVNIRYSKSAGEFKGMPVKVFTEYQLPLLSYIPTSDGNIDNINSKVAVMTLVKDSISDSYLRATIFNLMALIGKNPCLA